MTDEDIQPRLRRNQIHLYFDAREPPQIHVPSGSHLTIETEDAHLGTIRTEGDVYQSVAHVLDRLSGANPVTGPIYIDGVEPGDCVAITFRDIVPGPLEPQGYTVLTPGLGGLVSNYTLQPPLPARTVIWPIRDGSVIFRAGGRTIKIPARPFLGTIGVAPAGERRVTYAHGSDFLGNIDLPVIGVGTTVVIRANVPGALVSLGDAHAVQGNGEISGAGVECQADVTIRLDRIPQSQSEYVALPQVNASDFIGSIAASMGPTLDNAIRAAYVDIIKRLVQFHGFQVHEAYMLASQTGRVEIGQVVDPLYSVAVTLDRKYIA